MAFDTNILDETVRTRLIQDGNSDFIAARFRRAIVQLSAISFEKFERVLRDKRQM